MNFVSIVILSRAKFGKVSYQRFFELQVSRSFLLRLNRRWRKVFYIEGFLHFCFGLTKTFAPLSLFALAIGIRWSYSQSRHTSTGLDLASETHFWAKSFVSFSKF